MLPQQIKLMVIFHLLVNLLCSCLYEKTWLGSKYNQHKQDLHSSKQSQLQVISDHTPYRKGKCNLEVDEENKKLPSIDQTPSFNKHSSKARFMITVPKCSIKPLSIAVTTVVKLMHKQRKTYDSRSHYFLGIEFFPTCY